MEIAINIIISLVLIVMGYIVTCNYLSEKKLYSLDINILKVNSIQKVAYFIFALGVSALLISLFEIIYQQPLMQQAKLLSLTLILIPIAIVDYKFHKIPNQFLIFALILRIIYCVIEFVISPTDAFDILKDSLLGAIIIGVFFLLILLVFKNSIGMGDIKLFALMAIYQGLWGAVNSVFFSLLVSFFYSIMLLITRKKNRKDLISFGPSILIGTIIAISLAGI